MRSLAEPLLIKHSTTKLISERGNIPVTVRPQPLGIVKLAANTDRSQAMHCHLRKIKHPTGSSWWGVAFNSSQLRVRRAPLPRPPVGVCLLEALLRAVGFRRVCDHNAKDYMALDPDVKTLVLNNP